MKTTLGYIRKADQDFGMIEPGDKVLVGISGGKDSLLLAHALGMYRRLRHEDFTLEAIMLTTGPEPPNTAVIEQFCAERNIPLRVRYTDLYQILFEIRKEENPCALCAKMRRAMLCDACKDVGANKLALGHHRDDAIETLLMSLIYEGRLHTFHPKTYMSRSDLTVIRPLVYMPEKEVIHMQRVLELPVMKNPCPADGHTSRQEMKDLIKELTKRWPNLPDRMLSALKNEKQYGLWWHDGEPHPIMPKKPTEMKESEETAAQ